MNLANKYRPKYWKDLVEQDAVKQILEYQLQSKQFSNAYLFTGSAGTGKTTSARIFANEINNWKGEPIEMDAASNNGVDDVRKIIDGSKFKSISGGEYKCYIIDECFAAGTMVTTRNGEAPIENISIGEEVASMTGYKKVINIFTKYVPVCSAIVVKIKDKYILTTNNHLFFTNKGWVEAQNLNPSHVVYTFDNIHNLWANLTNKVNALDITFNIESGGYWQRPNLESEVIQLLDNHGERITEIHSYNSNTDYITMYDLEVEDDHSYFVEDILVHNCHQLTQAAWAAMLKLLEEPPSKSIFLLCTTDPQKIPDTILSRVLRFDFQKITHSSVVNRINYILQQEQASEDGLYVQGWDQEALSYIAIIANGGMRDAITMLDKCLNYSNNLTVEAVVKALGVTNYDQMFSILNGFVNKNEAQLMSNIENLYSSGTDLKQFIKSFIQFVLDLCKFDLFQDFQYVQIPPSFQSTLMQYSKENYIYFRKLLEMLINVNYKIKWETNPKMLIQTEFLLEILR